MEKTMCLSAAMKLLRSLDEEKSEILGKERENSSYQVVSGIEADPPDYDFAATQSQLEKLDETVCNIRHAINQANATRPVGDTGFTVDQILISMAQMNSRLAVLQSMSQKPKKSQPRFMGALESQSVVVHTNYDPDEIKTCYRKLREKISNLQMALDLHNLSTNITFEVLVE